MIAVRYLKFPTAFAENITIACFGSSGRPWIDSLARCVLSYTKSLAACILPLGVAQKPRYRTDSDSGAMGRGLLFIFVYYESIKPELQRRLIYEYRCDERLKTKNEESTHLVDTGLVVELEHLKSKSRLIDEKFASVRGECDCVRLRCDWCPV